MLLAQLTDTHIADPETDTELLVDNNARLAAAVERLNAESVQPEAILATGDMTDNGTAVEMDLLAELLEPLRAPLLALPGNHDVRETFRDAFDMPWATEDSHLSWAVDVGDLHIIGLDTLRPGSHGGLFDEERRRWLVEALAESEDRPTMIAMHHPPFLSGIHWMDSMRLEGAEDFADVVAATSNVVRIVCGHLHRPLTTTIGGVTTSVCPSTIHHVELNLDPAAPIEVIRDPAGYQLHHRNGSGWVSHIRYIDTGEPPVKPRWSLS